jgi:hypothetical protein
MTYIKTLCLAAALLVLSPVSAGAVTIYFAGGEDTSVSFVGTQTAFNSSPLTGRSAFERGYLGAGNNTVTDPPANRLVSPTFTPNSSLWVHAQASTQVTTPQTGGQIIILRSPDGVARILLRQTTTFGQFKVSTRNAAGTITDVATASASPVMVFNVTTAIDMQVIYGCTAADKINLYLNGVSVMAFTGSSLCTDAATQLNQVEFANVNNNISANVNGTGWAEIIVADSDTRGMALWPLAPVAAGNTQSWTPNTVGNVNPILINDTNFVSTTTNNALSQWTTPTAAPTGTWNVLAVVQEARVRAPVTGPLHFEWLCRSGGTDNVTGSLTPPTAAFGNFSNQIWANNCKTGSPWAISDIAAGFNLGIESLP